MTKISDLVALSGSAVDDANDLLPVVDMSEAGAARNKKITFDETRIALGLSSADSPQFTALNLGHASDTTITRVSAGVVAIEGVNIVTTAGGVTFAADIVVPDEAYDATAWNGSLEVPTKNAVRDKIESLSVGGGIDVEDEGVSETVGATTLNFVGAGVTAADAGGGQVDITIPGGGGGGVDVEDEGVAEATGATTLNFTGAGVTATDAGGGVVDVTIPGGGSSALSALYEDQKAANVAGGTSTSGAWGARQLNTEVYDDIGLSLHAATVTITIASPGEITWTAHGLKAGSVVVFTTTGALPTGLTAGTPYYVIATGLTANVFRVSATLGGSVINTSGTQSGVHTATSSAISLAAGTYEIDASSSFFDCDAFRLRLRDITNDVTLLLSVNAYDSGTNAGGATGPISGRFTLAGTALVELQFRVTTTSGSANGLGVVSNFGELEIYTRLKLTKLS